MKRPCFAYSLALALFFAASLKSEAGSIDVAPNQDPNQVEQLGFPTTYTATPTPNGFTPQTISWSWRQTDCVNGPSNFFQAGPTFTYGIPGEFDIQAVISYPSVSNPNLNPNPPASETLTKHVVIPRPVISQTTNVGAKSDYGTRTPGPDAIDPTSMTLNGQPGIWICFVLTSAGKPIGPDINGMTAQESITNWLDQGTKRADSGWTPEPGSDSRFVLGPTPDGLFPFAICDFKYAGQPDPGGMYPVGSFSTFTQELRLNWSTLCGDEINFSLGSKNWSDNGFTTPSNQWNVTNQ